MNAPDRFLKFVVPDGEARTSFIRDTKIERAGTYKVLCEDHTLGNLLRMQLHRNPEVLFAAYQVPHPLANHVLIRLPTTRKSSPTEARKQAIEEVRGEVDDLKNQFVNQVINMQQMAQGEAGAMGQGQMNYAGGY